MPKSIAVLGAGPALGRAIAHRYARDDYAVVVVARRQEPLERLATELTSTGATAHAITADLADVDAIPMLAGQIRARVGDVDAFYYGAAAGGFVAATELTPQHAREMMPLSLYAPLALAREFLPPMLERGDGAILTAQGASALQGLPHMSGPGPALAAQRNYLQSLHAEVAEHGVYVGALYIGAAIEHSAFHAQREAAKANGAAVPEMPTVDPAELADVLRTMHSTKGPFEATYSERVFDR